MKTITCIDTGRMEEIRDDVAERLQEQGVIEERMTGWVAANDEAFKEALDDLDLMICDFCSSPEVSWRFPAADFTMFKEGNIDHASRSDWAACEICHHLVEQKLWEDLARRSVRNFEELIESPGAAVMLIEVVRSNNARFEQSRTGPAVRVRGGDE